MGKTIELSLKEFLIVALRRWLPILLCALIVATALGVQGYFAQQSAAGELQDVYEKEFVTYEQNIKANRTSIAYYTEKRNAVSEYNQNSILMQMDPYKKQSAFISVSIDVEPDVFYLNTINQQTLGLVELKAALIDRIVSHYLLLAMNTPLADVLKDVLPTEYDEVYLREIIQTSREDGGIITIRAFGNDDIDPMLLVESIYSYLLKNQPVITESVANHTMSILSKSSRIEMDTVLAEKQNAQRNLVAEYGNEISKLLNEISVIQSKRPTAPDLSSQVVKNVLLGLLIGTVIGIMLVIFFYVAKLPIQTPEQIQRQFGIRHLGGIPHRSRTLLGRLGDRMAGESTSISEADALDIVSANISEVIANHKRILVTGTAQESIIVDFTQKLTAASGEKESDVVYLYGNDINVSASTIRELMASDAVILVERTDASRLRDISKEIERIKLSNKEVLGYVLC